MTLIELIAFIAIAGIVATVLIQAFSGTMRGSHFGKEVTQATQLAQQRMEVIMGQRKRLGYSGFIGGDYDPCQAPPVLAPPWSTSQICSTTVYGAGSFAVVSTAPIADSCGIGCAEITVTVTSPYGGQLASLTYQVWGY